MLTIFFILASLFFGLAYLKYGKFLTRLFELNNRNKTPAHTISDGIDYVPASTLVLFGHHFSSIAGAGPVIGPIIAGLAFGWLPVWLKKKGKPVWFVVVPMIFMLVMTLWALVMLIQQYKFSLLGIIGDILLLLAALLILEAIKIFEVKHHLWRFIKKKR